MRRLTFARLSAVVGVAGVVLLLASCGSHISTKISSPFAQEGAREEQKQRTEAVLREVEERNKAVESDAGWRDKAYSEFMIRQLSAIGEEEYAKYAQYLDNGALYVIVHPAYYTFFHDHELPDSGAGQSSQNAMEKFLGTTVYSSRAQLIRAQEKMLRDFLEYMSTGKKLVVLILPHDYRDYRGYKFRGGRDEYMRFINEVTNESSSVLYLYSKKPNRGTLYEKDRRRLLKFLYAIRAKEILVGGGYIGRCLEDFYKDVEQYYSEDRIFVVPEITSISPVDVSSDVASDMLSPDGTVDVTKLTANIKANVLGNQEIVPKTRNLRYNEVAP